ncbi:MAG: nitrogenase component 1 [Thermodesulfobacteriota bacterium]
MKIAIYGKGGIGKSTVTANLSAALAEEGRRVLQIGCDPKHDSTRLLLDGRNPPTVLDCLRDTLPAERRLEDLLHVGYAGVTCAEAGGPEPGVGCAGRGILSAFDLFDRLGLRQDDYDVVLYDVLGDVVCGGFAVPLRKGFADVVYIVASEEFMALYAANNILRGVRNFEKDGGAAEHRAAGLILNSRGADEDPGRVDRFAEAVGLPVVARIPRSERFRRAEERNRTVVQTFPDSPEAALFRHLARGVRNGSRRFPASPLSDPALEAAVFGTRGGGDAESGGKGDVEKGKKGDGKISDHAASSRPRVPASPPPRPTASPLSKSMWFREPLHGCAFTGAISMLTQIREAVVVAHGPRSCSHLAGRTVLSSGIRVRRRQGRRLPRQLAPALVSTDMDEDVVIYGGNDRLAETLRKTLARGPAAVFVVTACPSGVIGDDPEAAIRSVQSDFPGIPILPIASDGNIRGDYMQGVINACLEGGAALVDPGVRPAGHRVNILAEKNIANNAESNFAAVAAMLDAMGIAVNCRFIRDTSVEALRNFGKARLNLLAHEDHLGRLLRSALKEKTGAVFAENPFPVGFFETRRWLEEIGGFFGKTKAAEGLAAAHREGYRAALERLRPSLAGKRLMIVSFLHDVDWILEVAFDLGMVVEKVGVLNYIQDHRFRTRFGDRFPVETDYDAEKRDADLERIRPDLLLCNYVPKTLPIAVHADTLPLCPDVGVYGGLAQARRWATLLKSPIREGWRDDG